MIGNTQTRSVFPDIRILISIALIAIAALGCSFSTDPETPEIPEFPDIPELPLSEASGRARVERTLPWADVVKTCSGIDDAQPITEFATLASTSQHQSTDNLKVNEYAGEVWKSSRLLVELSATSNVPRSFYATITYLNDKGFASLRLEELESLGYESTLSGTTLIVQSNPDEHPIQGDRSSDQVFVFDDQVVSNIVVGYGNGAQPFCSRDELYVLAERLVAGNKK